jgi:hypothetical protein
MQPKNTALSRTGQALTVVYNTPTANQFLL